jgi:type IV pilus assembly protein PilM
MFNFSKTLSSIGLDISSGSIKLMQVKKDGKNFVVKAFSRASLPKGAVINDLVADQKTFAFLIKQALDKPQFGRFDTQYVTVSLPEAKSFIRVIQIPKMSDLESESAVPYEAESFIPMPIDQVYLDWQKVGETSEKNNILIIASPKEYVEKYLELIDLSGLKPTALEAESQSLCRSLIGWKSEETSFIADIDASRSNLVMIEAGNLQFSSTVPIAGGAFTESLARSLGVASAKAEEIKKKVGLLNTAEYPNIKISLAPILNNLTAEIKNVLKFHSERSEKPVEKVILAGGGAKLKGMIDLMQNDFASEGNIKVELGNPWRNLSELKSPPIFGEEALSWSTAIGLAIRNYEE